MRRSAQNFSAKVTFPFPPGEVCAAAFGIARRRHGKTDSVAKRCRISNTFAEEIFNTRRTCRFSVRRPPSPIRPPRASCDAYDKKLRSLPLGSEINRVGLRFRPSHLLLDEFLKTRVFSDWSEGRIELKIKVRL